MSTHLCLAQRLLCYNFGTRAALRRVGEGFVRIAHAKADSTPRTSQAVPHPSTNRALCRLTSEVGRDPVHSTRYGRQRVPMVSIACRSRPEARYAGHWRIQWAWAAGRVWGDSARALERYERWNAVAQMGGGWAWRSQGHALLQPPFVRARELNEPH